MHLSPAIKARVEEDVRVNIQMAKLYGKNLKVTFHLSMNAKSTKFLTFRPTVRSHDFVHIAHWDMDDVAQAVYVVLEELNASIEAACINLGAVEGQLKDISRHFNLCQRLQFEPYND